MLRNLERLKTEQFGPQAFVDVVKNLAQVIDIMGSEESAVTLNYETDDCEVGDLVPTITIGVTRVRKTQSRALEDADG